MKALYDYFKVVLINDDQNTDVLETRYLDRGIILNFAPNRLQQTIIESYIADSNIRTLFSVREAEGVALYEKILKQLAHYRASYWFNAPEAVMNIEGIDKPLSLVAIRGVNRGELQAMVDDILYANRPAKDTELLVKIMAEYSLVYRLNEVQNNELRIQLFDETKDVFDDGDDAVRYIVYKCTKQPLLIKSSEVIAQVQVEGKVISAMFLERHAVPLSHCFNRHKRIIVALKMGSTSTAVRAEINRITRLSKRYHRPVGMPKSKTFINDALRGWGVYDREDLRQFKTADLFRYLNLLSFKKLGLTYDMFIIRNGKTWASNDRPVHIVTLLEEIEKLVLDVLSERLTKSLYGKAVVLPKAIDYGLPTTRKQTVGHLPFGTKITVDSDLSAGIYWRNEWGARDLDLSAIDEHGYRVGWGRLAGYNNESGLYFSGDLIDAPNGAMEFITPTNKSPAFGLFVSIFTGEPGCEAELLVGKRDSDKWIENADIREKFKLQSRGNVIGFVDGQTFTVFLGRLDNKRATFDTNSLVIQKGKSYTWTVKKLLEHCGLPWREEGEADHDLTYSSFTFDKLEALFSM